MKSYFQTLLIIFVAFLLGFALSPHLTFLTWDNYEMFLPSTYGAHSLWLKGIIPVWNPSQHLGEPTAALAQYSVFYFPYFLFTLVIHLFSLPIKCFVYLSLIFHLIVLTIGWWRLLSLLGYSEKSKRLGAIAICSLGPVLAATPIWMHVLAVTAWIPMGLWILLIPFDLKRRDHVFSLFALSQIVMTGHIQNSFYALFAMALVSIFFHLLRGALRRFILPSLAIVVFTLLSSAPAWLPTATTLKDTAVKISEENFFFGSVPIKNILLGMVTPMGTSSEMVYTSHTAATYFGPWLIVTLISLFTARRRVQRESLAWSLALACVPVVFLFLVFSLGKNTPIYPWTFSIPIWNSFKLTSRFLFPTGVMFLLMCFSFLESSRYSIRNSSIWIIAVAGLAGFIGYESLKELPLLWGLTVLGTGLALAIQNQKISAAGAAILLTALLGIIGFKQHRIYPKPLEEAKLQLPTEDRLLPVSLTELSAEPYQNSLERGLFQFATVGGYLSATGSLSALQAKHYQELLPSNNYGLLHPNTAIALLRSSVRQILNIKYVTILKSEADDFTKYIGQENIESRVENGQTVIFAFKTVLPRLHFPNQVEGKILHANYQLDGTVSAIVETNSPQYLVYSTTYDRNFIANVNSDEVPIQKVSTALMAIELPKGRHTVTFFYSRKWVYSGIILMFLSWSIAFAILRRYAYK